MELNENQLAGVAKWFADGASLDEIQKRLAAEFGVHVTYLDLRLFVADLPQPKDVAKDEDVGDVGARRPAGEDVPADGDDLGEPSVPPVADDDGGAADTQPAESAGDVSVSLDPITPAGVMAAGGVTFSDGTSGKWYLDRYGRLGLSGMAEGYRPSPEDGALFQSRLVELLQSKGLM